MVTMAFLAIIMLVAAFGVSYVADAYSRGFDRTNQNIVREYGRKHDFAAISLDSVKKFTTVPDIVSGINSYTSLTPNDGFAMTASVSQRFCKSWVNSYLNFNKVIINGKPFAHVKTIAQVKELVSECHSGSNEISLIYIRPTIVQ